MKKHVHIIGIGGIGVSAIARYYAFCGYSVSGSDSVESTLTRTLQNEGITIFIGHHKDNVPSHTSLVIFSEAIITKPDLAVEEQLVSNPEIGRANELGIPTKSYPVALGEIINAHYGIAISGSHGKSTTTAMTAVAMAGTEPGISAIIGTQVPDLGNTNFYAEKSENFVIEACEYKRSFLAYRPAITVITNIDLDHLDYYKNIDDYRSAFQELVDQTQEYVIISAYDAQSKLLNIPEEKKIVVHSRGENSAYIAYKAKVEDLETGTISYEEKTLPIPDMALQVPGKHILYDAHLAYTVARLR